MYISNPSKILLINHKRNQRVPPQAFFQPRGKSRSKMLLVWFQLLSMTLNWFVIKKTWTDVDLLLQISDPHLNGILIYKMIKAP